MNPEMKVKVLNLCDVFYDLYHKWNIFHIKLLDSLEIMLKLREKGKNLQPFTE